jgi:hypothetical protein
MILNDLFLDNRMQGMHRSPAFAGTASFCEPHVLIASEDNP